MKPSLRALIVDDEPPARRWLRELLSKQDGIQVAGEAGSVAEAVELAARKSPDVIFLDVQMPPSSGFDLLPKLIPLPKIVFVTAYDAYAVKAFEANALDYLLKPVRPERMAETCRRLFANSPVPPSLDSAAEPERDAELAPGDLIPLQDGGTFRMVPVVGIAAVEAQGAYTRVHLSGQGSLLLHRGIGEWETLLPSPPFHRLGRSVIVHLGLIRSVDTVTRDETRVEFEGVEAPLVLGRIAAGRLRKTMRGS